MGKEGIFNNKNVDLKKLAKLIEKFFLGENFSEVDMLEDPNGSWYEVQAKKKGVLRTLTSQRKSLHVAIKGSPDSFAIHVGVGEWGSNIAGVALFNPGVSLLGIGLKDIIEYKRIIKNKIRDCRVFKSCDPSYF